MSEYQICRLTPSLVASWRKDLHPDLKWSLSHPMDRETAEEIKETLEAQSLPGRWKFSKKWFSKKHGAIFMLKELVERKEPEDVSAESLCVRERDDRGEHCDNGFGDPEWQGEAGVLGTA